MRGVTISIPGLRYYDEPIVLSSGERSHWFIDARQMFGDEDLRKQIFSCWERKLNNYSQWHLIGVPEGGLCWAEGMAHHLNTRRGTPWPHITWGYPDSVFPDGSSVAVIEDVVTTGRSLFSITKKYTSATTLAVVVRNPAIRVGCTWATIDLRENSSART